MVRHGFHSPLSLEQLSIVLVLQDEKSTVCFFLLYKKVKREKIMA